MPMEDVVEIKGGKRKVSSRKFFPGYLLIEAEMSVIFGTSLKIRQKSPAF